MGWEKALTYVPNLVISDVVMPEMDGIALCNLLKSDERTNHIPVVLLTAKAEIEHRINGLRAGADAYVPKPFHPDHLRIRIKKLIEQRRKLRRKYLQWSETQSEESLGLTEDEQFLLKVSKVIESHLSDSEFKVGQLERELGMSHMQLYRKLKALTDQSANDLFER